MEFNGVSKRISVNTSLKNARIFDDDSWDAETAGFLIKKEPVDQQESPEPNSENVKIKPEAVEEDPHLSSLEERNGVGPYLLGEKRYFGNVKIKNEVFEENPHHSSLDECNKVAPNLKIKQEIVESEEYPHEENSFLQIDKKKIGNRNEKNWDFGNAHLDQIDMEIKREVLYGGPEGDDTEESYLDKIDQQIRMEIINTPNKMDMKNSSMDDSNPSPFNKELFKHFSLKQENNDSPERAIQSSGRDTRKSVKRTVFTRNSPYKRHSPNKMESSAKNNSERIPVKERLGIKDSSEIPNKKPRKLIEKETDPAVLDRRQKQIDFGKNTIGYDNYLKLVPKNRRTRDDVRTPDKSVKYSRRGWDGLIKQWRLKLHKYDPA